MAVIPKRLGMSNGLPSAATTLYTAPAGTTAIVKNVIVTNASLSQIAVTLSVSGVYLLYAMTIEPKGTVAMDMSVVMNPGATITAFGSTTNTLAIYISGVEVS